ncbi:hypothetical protein [Cytobacillus sp. IB215665]|uniref:hypothetical protein n=1 Tax=Cytobacillus sp. IB215665 TaxID=3097357 RepID=UPI002A0AE9B4|nr:hypothetical protein [Cytobacillus sp. IB215665]MDX8365423.1 hypothetical protein [Cytobacillus sp. IB215665]
MKKEQKDKKLTVTSGKLKDIDAQLEKLNIRGSVTIPHDVNVKVISSHGSSSFHSKVVADLLKNAGSCVIKGNVEIAEIENMGNLHITNGKAQKIVSSGSVTIDQILQTDQMKCNGVVFAKELFAKQFHIKLSANSHINKLIAKEIIVERDRKTIPLVKKKKLVSEFIKGENINLSHAEIDVVEGNIVEIGKSCKINTLYYKESYKISPKSQVLHIKKKG